MKAFLEEYSLLVCVLIAFAVLTALVLWTSNKGSESATKAVNGFTNKAESVMNANGVQMGEAENVGNISTTPSPAPGH